MQMNGNQTPVTQSRHCLVDLRAHGIGLYRAISQHTADGLEAQREHVVFNGCQSGLDLRWQRADQVLQGVQTHLLHSLELLLKLPR
ncbi:hypothetical protein D3C71_1660850 [compost metagenome]